MLILLVAEDPLGSYNMACGGLLAGHHLLLGMISRYHFEQLGSNEVPTLIPIESHLEGGE
jgi:hypothetical protein